MLTSHDPASPAWICPDLVFDSGHLEAGNAVRLEGGRVVEVRPRSDLPPGAHCAPLTGVLSPGYVDLQVNGGGGVLLNTDPTPEGMRKIAAAHRGLGTAAILPTLITDAPDRLERAAAAALATKGERGLLGLHIEGPHIAEARRGTHNAASVRPLDEATMAVVRDLRANGVRVLITLAPEAATTDQIAALAETGAIVSIGHSNATAREANAALDAGARAFTHLFNAMSQMTGREPGVTGAAIASDAYVGIICDGIHVSDTMVRLAIRARPVEDRMFLVSDAMPTVGGPASFDLYGQRITLSDGRLINSDGGLAGAHVTQAEGVHRLVGEVGLSLQAALRMALSTPAELIGAPELARLTGQSVEDLIVVAETGAYVGPLTKTLEPA